MNSQNHSWLKEPEIDTPLEVIGSCCDSPSRQEEIKKLSIELDDMIDCMYGD